MGRMSRIKVRIEETERHPIAENVNDTFVPIGVLAAIIVKRLAERLGK